MGPEIIEKENVVGVFKGFTESNLEFHADLVLPYQSKFSNIPIRGQFILIQLDNEDEALLGRISSVSSDGKLSHGAGEEYNLRAVKEGRPIPEDIREQYVKYRVDVRVLGNIKKVRDEVTFAPSHRRLPHVGSCVAFPSDDLLKEIVGSNQSGASIGHFSLGEYIYSGTGKRLPNSKLWMRQLDPEIEVKFSAKNLVSRRSFVFARAGFGKSNLNKLLFSRLYSEPHTVTKRGGREVPVGTIVFDRDGEYFWPDDKGRPGLCDVEALNDELVVFTKRKAPSDFYNSFVAGNIMLDIRKFRPSDIISIALSQERQEQQNVRKLKSLSMERWGKLVDLIAELKNDAPKDEVMTLLRLEPNQEAEALAARSNMTNIVNMLHDSSSLFRNGLLQALEDGKLCIVDVSQLGGEQALMLSGIVLRMIFNHNQEEFTKAHSKTIPTIAVLEEAQSVLRDNVPAAEPFISWVKEGRKYDLGALMITQQPGSISTDILSQGDNWFIFHLLSAADLYNVRKANSHFSDDILSSLLNEPIVGQCVFWSSVGEMPYPISVRIASFEDGLSSLDPEFNRGAVMTYASNLRDQMHEITKSSDEECLDQIEAMEPCGKKLDVAKSIRADVVEGLSQNQRFLKMLDDGELNWGTTMRFIDEIVPSMIRNDRQQIYQMVAPVLDMLLGPQDEFWHTVRKDNKAFIEKIGDR